MSDRTCSIDGCGRVHAGRGLCSTHYSGWWRRLRRDPERYAVFNAEREAAKVSKLQRIADPVKACTKCGEVKCKAEFSRMPRNSDGLHSWCKQCLRNLANMNYDVDAAREHHAEKKCDPEYVAMKKAAYDRWRAEHPDRAKAATRQWRQANADHVKAVHDAWTAANMERVRVSKRVTRQRRRAVMAETRVGPVRLLAILERDGMSCYLCHSEIQSVDELHFDHVIPLSRGGSHTMDNIKPTHETCNLRKNNKLLSELDWYAT